MSDFDKMNIGETLKEGLKECVKHEIDRPFLKISKFTPWQNIKRDMKSFTETEHAIIDMKSNIVCSIVAARKELEMSQQKLSELTGLSVDLINRIEIRNITPSLNSLLIICVALNLDIKLNKIGDK